MKEAIENLEKTISECKRKIELCKQGISSLQQICEHQDEKGNETWKPIGHDSHYRHFECRICFKRIKEQRYGLGLGEEAD